MNRARSALFQTSYYSFGGAVVALLILVLSQLARTVAPPAGADLPCATQPPLSVSLPDTLPRLPGTPATPATAVTAAAVPSLTATPAAALTPRAAAPSATGTAALQRPVATPPVEAPPAPIRALFRADDPPAAHGLLISGGALMPWVIPQPCRLTAEQRRGHPLPCLNLLPPAGSLCVSGAAGNGGLSSDAATPLFALQATRVTLRDAGGNLRLDSLQGYFRYDDPGRGLLLLCPRISLLERIGSNARRFSAACSNGGADGWSVSGQVTDGGTAAPDSVGLTIQAPDGRQVSLAGALTAGSVFVDDLPDDTP